ncbi:Leucine-responsive regulatory protein [Ewingella americana]|uniref:Leucine-responsive regulatory protein n=1 Tax=Ewingella americana TaxID=41202 RepID=A0A377NHA2_9GAMM|nr:Leucine-responsive regulatory protein [Ewingella americana]
MQQYKNLKIFRSVIWFLGDFDYLLKTRVPDMSAYRKLLGETLLRLPGVNDTRTYVVMEEVKQTNRLVIKTR